jgi:hypothetical protein
VEQLQELLKKLAEGADFARCFLHFFAFSHAFLVDADIAARRERSSFFLRHGSATTSEYNVP